MVADPSPGAVDHGSPSHAGGLVGIVVPAYNAERWIGATLRSVQAQTYEAWSCVVVDDGSQDGTVNVVRSFTAGDDRILLVTQPNGGVSSARNAGLRELPDCAYLTFLDSDDVWLPDAVEVLVTALQHRPDAVGAYGLAEYIDDRGQPLHPGLHPERQRWRRELKGRRLRLQEPTEDATFRTMIVVGPIWPPAVAVQRTETVVAVGGFDPTFPILQDWEFYLRLTRHGPYVAVDRHVAQYRRQDNNLTSQHDRVQYDADRVRRVAWASSDNTPQQRQELVHAWRRLERRQVLVLGRHLLRSLARRRWRSAGEAAVGTVLSAGLSLRPAPPQPSARRTRFTRPDDLLDVPL